MDDDDGQPQQNAVTSTFPPPPPFWKDFTTESVAQIASLRESYAAARNLDESQPFRIPDIPKNLRHLQPPPEPESGTWRVFGDFYKLEDELFRLDGDEIRRLVPQPEERDQDGKTFDRALIMKRLAKSVLLNYLELMGVLGTNPLVANDKITDIRDIFINLHHLINEYRPHQARESLIHLMQTHLDRTRAETNAIRDVKEKVERMLEGLASLKHDEPTEIEEITEKKDLLKPEEDMWQALVDDFP